MLTESVREGRVIGRMVVEELEVNVDLPEGLFDMPM
jgi:hypothetical protein